MALVAAAAAELPFASFNLFGNILISFAIKSTEFN